MSSAFDFSIPPFDRLTPPERDKLSKALDIGYYRKDRLVMAEGDEPQYFYVVIKGAIQEVQGEEVVNLIGPGDGFDAMGLIQGRVKSSFRVHEEAILHLLPKSLFLELTRANKAFEEFYFQTLSQRLDAQAARANTTQMAALMMATVDEAYLDPIHEIDAGKSLRDAARLMKERKVSALLVRDKNRTGLVTKTNLYETAVGEERTLETALGEIATWKLVTIDANDFLFNAQLLMARHGVRRVMVTRKDELVGFLELTNLLSYSTDHSYLVTVKVARATSIHELKDACDSLLPLVRSLQSAGMKMPFVTQFVTELNGKIFRKLFELIAPPELIEQSCLLVMGSEGRGEQILRTDQDNALILKDGADRELALKVAQDITDILLVFGYPLCPGNMMVSNPEWTKTISDFETDFFHWAHNPSEESFMRLAAFADARAVAGNARILEEARVSLFRTLSDNQGFYSHFAKPVQMFDTPIGLFNQIVTESGAHAGKLDLKKGGVFPIVHGLRALALERHIKETNSLERIEALKDVGAIDSQLAVDLADAFDLILSLRLKARLAQIAAGEEPDNYLDVQAMHKLERDALRHALGVVKEFKAYIVRHFNLHLF